MSGVTKRLPTGISARRELKSDDCEHSGHPNDADVLDQTVFESSHRGLR